MMVLQRDTGQCEEVLIWDKIWRRKRLIDKIIDYFRVKYTKIFVNILKKKVSKQSDIVELGCGTSKAAISLHRFVKSITAVDISKEALSISQCEAENQGVKNIKFIQDDCTQLKMAGETFDLVWSQGLIEHFYRPEILIEEHIRICKKNGLVIICTPAKFSFFYICYLICRVFGLTEIWPWADQDFYTKREIIEMLKKLQYETNCGIHVYWLRLFFLGLLILEIDKSKLKKSK